MNRMMKARPVSKSSLHLDIHDAPADHFCKMPIKKFTAVWGNVTFCLWSWPPSEYFQKWENFVVELCHLWCFSSRKQQTINRRLDYLEAFKMKRPVVYFDPFKPFWWFITVQLVVCSFDVWMAELWLFEILLKLFFVKDLKGPWVKSKRKGKSFSEMFMGLQTWKGTINSLSDIQIRTKWNVISKVALLPF